MPAMYRKDVTTFDLPGFQFTPLAVPSKGSTELAIWQLAIAPNAASDLHSVDKEEVFIVTAGRLLFEVEGGVGLDRPHGPRDRVRDGVEDALASLGLQPPVLDDDG